MSKISLLHSLKYTKIKVRSNGKFEYTGKVKHLCVSQIYKFIEKHTDISYVSRIINAETASLRAELYYNRMTCYENIYDFIASLPDGYISLVAITQLAPLGEFPRLIQRNDLIGDLYTVTLSGRDIMLLDPSPIRNFKGSEDPKYEYDGRGIIPVMPRQIVHVTCGDHCNRSITTINTVSPVIETDRIILSAVVINEDFAKYLSNTE